MIKVLTDQSASDSEPAIILTESNEHSKPRSAPNMKGDVICWQLASRRGSRRGERNGGRGGERGREREKECHGAGEGKMEEKSDRSRTATPLPPPIPALEHGCHRPLGRPRWDLLMKLRCEEAEAKSMGCQALAGILFPREGTSGLPPSPPPSVPAY